MDQVNAPPTSTLENSFFPAEQQPPDEALPNEVLAGAKQSFKQPVASSRDIKTPQTPSYNPASLLNPKASASSAAAKDGEDASSHDENGELGAGAMIERLNGLTDRADAPVNKRKAGVIELDEPDEEEHKKHKSTFNISNGGVIGDHLKQSRQQNAPQPIDLTADDDDDVQVIKDVGNEEVCLGVFGATGLIHQLPTLPSSLFRTFGKGFWPRAKVSFRRESQANTVLSLIDPSGNKIGTIDPRAANAICPLLQGATVNRCRFKTYLLSRARAKDDIPGKRVSDNWPLDITVFAPRRNGPQIGRYLSQKGIWLRTPQTNPGKETVNPHEGPTLFHRPAATTGRPAQMSHVSRTVEEMRRETNTMFDQLSKTADAVPETNTSTEIITTPLMAHQKQALHFLMAHEQVDGSGSRGELSLWKERTKPDGQQHWYHVITGQEQAEKPEPMQGGILADVMGLGKTLSILALITETVAEAKKCKDYAKGTLIICPKSVMANWQEQIKTHTTAGALKVYAYHGSGRITEKAALADYDIVITTYNTAASEYGDRNRQQKPLALLNWFRIVLDEAHSIRTQSTQVFKACRDLNAQRRWAVTGTPVQNGLDDLGALIKFLQLKPFDSPTAWAQYIISPLKNGDADALNYLQILVASITLRRLKDTVELPGRIEETERLTFSDTEWLLYRQFSKKAGTQLRTMTQGNSNGLKGRAYAHVLKAIGRMRAICAHGREMLNEDDMKEIQGSDGTTAIVLDLGDEPDFKDVAEDFTSAKMAYDAYKMMRDSEVALCQQCDKKLVVKSDSEEQEDPEILDEEGNVSDNQEDDETIGFLTPCLHLICSDCRDEYERLSHEDFTEDGYYTCPHCGQYMRFDLFELSKSGLNEADQDKASRKLRASKWDEDSYSGPHTKVKRLIENLRQSKTETSKLPDGEPPIRSVVFSGWTSYLDLIEYALGKENFGTLRLDGTMSVKARREVLEQFKTDDAKTVLLVSIKAGGQGLNFTSASKVYVMEPQFNPGVEQQAVDRVHRMGQKRDVHIKHFIMQGPGDEPTIEGGILKLQQVKEQMAKMATDNKRRSADEKNQMLKELRGYLK